MRSSARKQWKRNVLKAQERIRLETGTSQNPQNCVHIKTRLSLEILSYIKMRSSYLFEKSLNFRQTQNEILRGVSFYHNIGLYIPNSIIQIL